MSGLKSPPALKTLAFTVEYNNKRFVNYNDILTCFPILATWQGCCLVKNCDMYGVHNHVLPANDFHFDVHPILAHISPVYVTPPQSKDLSVDVWRIISGKRSLKRKYDEVIQY